MRSEKALVSSKNLVTAQAVKNETNVVLGRALKNLPLRKNTCPDKGAIHVPENSRCNANEFFNRGRHKPAFDAPALICNPLSHHLRVFGLVNRKAIKRCGERELRLRTQCRDQRDNRSRI